MKQETINRIRKFTEDREWRQYHTPANLAKSKADYRDYQNGSVIVLPTYGIMKH